MRYVPKNKRSKPTQTFPGEFTNSSNGVSYSGEVVQLSNGRYYAYVDGDIDPLQQLTRAVPEDDFGHAIDFTELIPRGDFYFDYVDLKDNKLSYTTDVPKANYTLEPRNYEKGLFTRFFVKNKVTQEVYEIGPNHYRALISRNTEFHWPSYTIVEFNWKIAGDVADKEISGYIVEGVETFNRKAVEEASKVIPELQTILTDYLEYYQ